MEHRQVHQAVGTFREGPQIDCAATRSRCVGPLPALPLRQPPFLVCPLTHVEHCGARQIESARRTEERCAEGDMLTPDALRLFLRLVHNRLFDREHRRSRRDGQRLLDVERCAVRAHPEPDGGSLGGILRDLGVPRHQRRLGVLADLGAAVVRRRACGRSQRLPSAFIHIKPLAGRPAGGRHEASRVANAPGSAPHEVRIRGFVDQLIHVRSLVGQDRDAQ